MLTIHIYINFNCSYENITPLLWSSYPCWNRCQRGTGMKLLFLWRLWNTSLFSYLNNLFILNDTEYIILARQWCKNKHYCSSKYLLGLTSVRSGSHWPLASEVTWSMSALTSGGQRTMPGSPGLRWDALAVTLPTEYYGSVPVRVSAAAGKEDS